LPSLTLAHISDLHIGPLPSPGLRALLGKRITGYLSWKLKRAAVHRREVLNTLAADLAVQRPDHTAVTGDLVNISLSGEFVQAVISCGSLGQATTSQSCQATTTPMSPCLGHNRPGCGATT